MSDYYLKECFKCKEKTIHKIHSFSKTKGVRVQCTRCLKIPRRHYSIKKLIPYVFTEMKGGNEDGK